MAAGTKKNVASGRKIPIKFGTVDRTIKGKKEKRDLVSYIPQSTITALDIKLSPATKSGSAPKLVADKKGRKRLAGGATGTRTGARTLKAAAEDGQVFHSIIIPSGCSYALAVSILHKNSKARIFKKVGTRERNFGDPKKRAEKKVKGAK